MSNGPKYNPVTAKTLTSAAPIAPIIKGGKKKTNPNTNPISERYKLISEFGNKAIVKPINAITKINKLGTFLVK